MAIYVTEIDMPQFADVLRAVGVSVEIETGPEGVERDLVLFIPAKDGGENVAIFNIVQVKDDRELDRDDGSDEVDTSS